MLGTLGNLSESSLPLVMAVAALDSDALVRNNAWGGSAHTSAIVALLGAIEVCSCNTHMVSVSTNVCRHCTGSQGGGSQSWRCSSASQQSL